MRSKIRRLNSLKVWSAITGVALAVALILVLVPAEVSITSEGMLSLDIRTASANPGWLTGWTHRISHNLVAATGAGTDYQMKVRANYDSYPLQLDRTEDWTDLDCYDGVDFDGLGYLYCHPGGGAHGELRKFNVSTETKVDEATAPASDVDVTDPNGVAYKDGKVYVASCDNPPEGDGKIFEYNALTLDYITKYDLSAQLGETHGTTGLVWYDGYWWVLAHAAGNAKAKLLKYNSSFVYQDESYELDYWGGQEITIHEGLFYINSQALTSAYELPFYLVAYDPEDNFSVVFKQVLDEPDDLVPGVWGGIAENPDTNEVWTSGRHTYGALVYQNGLNFKGHCLTDFGDVRFTDNDGSTELDYYIEEKADSDYAIFWIEVADDLSSGTVPIYVYCGKAGEATTSDGAETFLEFDDFERGNDGDEVGGNWTEVQGTVEISTDQAYQGTRSMELVSVGYAGITKTCGTDYAVRFRLHKADATEFRLYYGDGTNRILVYHEADEDIAYYDGAVKDTGDNTKADAWVLFEINDFDWTNGDYDIFNEGGEVKADAGMYSSETGANDIRLGAALGGSAWIDEFIIRKYVSPEPTHGAWGEWETQSAEITNTPSSWTIGVVQINDVKYFSADNSQDDDYSLITNTGNCAVDIQIQGQNIEGGSYDWVLASSAGSEQYSLHANSEATPTVYDIEVKSSSYNDLCTDLAEDDTYDWSMKFTAPTAFNANDNGAQKSCTVTLVASAA